MPKSLESITKSILKLSEIFYQLSKFGAEGGLEAELKETALKGIKSKIDPRFEEIKEFIEVALSLLNTPEYSNVKISKEAENCYKILTKITKVCDNIIEYQSGIQDYINCIDELKLELNKIESSVGVVGGDLGNQHISRIVKPLYENIKMILGSDTSSPDGKNFVINIFKKINYSLQLDDAGREEIIESKFNKSDYQPIEDAKEFFNDFIKSSGDSVTLEDIDVNVYKAEIGELSGPEGRSKIFTAGVSQPVKARYLIDNAKERIQKIENKLKQIKETPENKNTIKTYKKMKNAYEASLQKLIENERLAKVIDTIQTQGEQQGWDEERIREEYAKKFKEHTSLLVSSYGAIYRSEERAKNLGELKEEDFKWLRDSLGLNDVEREKLNELINFFITCRIDPVRHGGEFSSQYKREFPSLINMIRKKSIDRNTFNIRIANLENLKKETEEDIIISREERHEKRMKSYEAKKMINEIISLLQNPILAKSDRCLSLIENFKNINIEDEGFSKKDKENIIKFQEELKNKNIETLIKEYKEVFKELKIAIEKEKRNIAAYPGSKATPALYCLMRHLIDNKKDLSQILGLELRKEIFVRWYFEVKRQELRMEIIKQIKDFDPTTYQKETVKREKEQLAAPETHFITHYSPENLDKLIKDLKRQIPIEQDPVKIQEMKKNIETWEDASNKIMQSRIFETKDPAEKITLISEIKEFIKNKLTDFINGEEQISVNIDRYTKLAIINFMPEIISLGENMTPTKSLSEAIEYAKEAVNLKQVVELINDIYGRIKDKKEWSDVDSKDKQDINEKIQIYSNIEMSQRQEERAKIINLYNKLPKELQESESI
jgi:hypothetical protein